MSSMSTPLPFRDFFNFVLRSSWLLLFLIGDSVLCLLFPLLCRSILSSALFQDLPISSLSKTFPFIPFPPPVVSFDPIIHGTSSVLEKLHVLNAIPFCFLESDISTFFSLLILTKTLLKCLDKQYSL